MVFVKLCLVWGLCMFFIDVVIYLTYFQGTVCYLSMTIGSQVMALLSDVHPITERRIYSANLRCNRKALLILRPIKVVLFIFEYCTVKVFYGSNIGPMLLSFRLFKSSLFN